jgi:hypothetical protein
MEVMVMDIKQASPRSLRSNDRTVIARSLRATMPESRYLNESME